MKMYASLSKALNAIFYRPSRQVVCIVSINGEGYFIIKSTTSASQSMDIAASAKFQITEELISKMVGYPVRTRTEEKFKKLQTFMLSDGIHHLFKTKTLHAEENLILNYEKMLKVFRNTNPTQKIHTIDIFLTHSPCAKKQIGNTSTSSCSSAKTLNKMKLPEGCLDKLTLFFKNRYPRPDSPKIKVKYVKLFEPKETYASSRLVEPVDIKLNEILSSSFKILDH